MNRLADALSPYLLQHASNPVDWFPWGEEAFEKARREEKPVFLSIGYATCHWCHVMERESFEDDEVAALMNEHLVAVKVDREERPDVDELYMTVCQALTGRGGWPLTIVMTPEKRPFFAATYLPKRARGGQAGLMELIPEIARVWREERERIEASADDITEALREGLKMEGAPGRALDAAVLDAAYNGLAARYDAEAGGFGMAPKFPTPHHLLFLLREHARLGSGPGDRALEMAEHTLHALRLGGIFDHVGFGFHRYATDRRWVLPHFEKMLHDQALLAMAYTEAFEVTRNDFYRRTAEDILEYVRRDLTGPEGAFFSAEDADSENEAGEMEEGAFYTWRWEELMQTLGEERGTLAAALFNLEREGNVRDEATQQRTGANVLYRTAADAFVAERLEMAPEALAERLEDIRQTLLEARSRRPRPLLDDKVLTDWNGLTIAALAKAARAFGDARYAERAGTAARFLLSTMRTEDGRLLHRYREGQAGITGHLDDYAFLVWGLIELYQATFEPDWLREAVDLHETMHRHFRDEEGGGYFLTADDAEELLVRQKPFYDGAVPSGNSVAALNALRLGRLTGRAELEEQAERTMRASAEVAEHPFAYTMMMTAAQFALGPAQEVTVAGEPGAADTEELLGILRARFLPNAVLHLRPEDDADLAALAPYTEAQTAQDGRATAYVCERFACQAPTADPGEMARQLDTATGKM